MTIQAWPFLVGRNKNLGYQTIVSPQFMANEGLSMVLAEAAGGDDSTPYAATYREILGSEVGDITLVFRVVKARANDYNLKGDEFLEDRGGRLIRLIEGFAVQGRMSSLQISWSDLQTVHDLIKDAYYQFWFANETFSAIPSSPFELFNKVREDDTNEPIQLVKEASLILSPAKMANRKPLPRRRMLLVALLVLTLFLTTGGILLRFIPGSSPLQVFCTNVVKKNYSEASHQFSNTLRPLPTEADVAAYFTSHPVRTCTSQQADNNLVTLSITFTDGTSVLIPTALTSDQKIATNVIVTLRQQKP